MFQPNLGTLQDLLKGEGIPWVTGWGIRFGAVDNSPIVVVVSMGVKGNLLFCLSAVVHSRPNELTLGSSGVSVCVRV
jgi:hypothetical protein